MGAFHLVTQGDKSIVLSLLLHEYKKKIECSLWRLVSLNGKHPMRLHLIVHINLFNIALCYGVLHLVYKLIYTQV